MPLTTAFRRKKATLIQFRLRRRAIQCSSTRQPSDEEPADQVGEPEPAQQAEQPAAART